MGESGQAARRAAMGAGALSTVAASLVTGSAPASAEALEVTNLNDSGPGSLRQAIETANANGDGEVDVITFDVGGVGVIELADDLPTILTPTIVDGPGTSSLAIDANGNGRVFYLYADGSAIRDLTIYGGDAGNAEANPGFGGAILVAGNAADVVLENLILFGNVAAVGGAVHQVPGSGNVTVDGIFAYDNEADTIGGAVVVEDGEIVDSQFLGNRAGTFGGAVSLGPTFSIAGLTKAFDGADDDTSHARLVDSVVSGNFAGLAGGGVFVLPLFYASIEGSSIVYNGLDDGDTTLYGGGVAVVGGEGLTAIENSTIAFNTGQYGGGVAVSLLGSATTLHSAKDAGPYAAVTIRHSTITSNQATEDGGNGLSILGEAPLDFGTLGAKDVDQELYGVLLDHTIVAGNDPETPENEDIVGEDPSRLRARFSLLGDGSAGIGNLGGNQFGVEDPELGGLLLEPGQIAPTMTPAPGSPAQDAGDPGFSAPPVTDQLGNPREQGRVDIGAVETEGETPPPPPPPGDGLCDPAPEDGFVDVPEANVHEANVDCIAFLGITTGGPEGRPANEYGPEIRVSRGQLASFLARVIVAAGGALPVDPPDAFSDDDGDVHELAINQLAALGIVSGKDDGTFGVHDQVRRDQMATLVALTYAVIVGEPLPEGEDAFVDDDGNAHEPNINALANAGIVRGTDPEAGLYNPLGTVPRDQMATFLTNLVRALHDLGFFVD